VGIFSIAVPIVTKNMKPTLITNYPKLARERCGFVDKEANECD